MKNQKICIIGDGLAGLTTAIALRKLNLNIDLFCRRSSEFSKKDKRTTAISESNYEFLKSKINLKNNNLFWPCKKIDLFYENKNEYINFLNLKNNNKNLMYIFENVKYKNNIFNELKKTKNITFLNKSIKEVNWSNSFVRLDNRKIYYDLIILCAGNKNALYEDISNNRSIKKDYQEFAITAAIKHNLKLEGSSQYFLKEGPLAILPFKKKIFSLVWSIPKNLLQKDAKTLIRKKLTSIFGKKAKVNILELQIFPLYLKLKTEYFKKNILILGQGIHSIHPIAGQGFNLILRDIKKLSQIIEKNLHLGLAIKDSYILKEFYDSRNPENTVIGLGNDLIHTFFKRNQFIDPIKVSLLKNIGKYDFVQKISKAISNKGFFS